MKHRHIILLLFTLFVISPIMAISMKVGDTKKLDIGNIPYLQACYWTISRPNDIVFTSTPHQVQTEVEIKAVKAFPATSPCVVQCKYYYLELDPTTGRYIYSRTGYKDWTIFVSENGDNNQGGGGQGDDESANLNIMLLGTGEIEITEGSNTTIEVGQGLAANWSSDDESIARITKISTNKFNVYGVSGGMTYVRVQGYNGSSASCLVRVIKEGEEGSEFYENSPEGIRVKYIIRSKEKAECMVGGTFGDDNNLRAVDINTSGTLTIPWQAKGYTVVGVQQAAFMKCKKLEKVVLPSTISFIMKLAFYECEKLKEINLPEGIKYIVNDIFHGCRSLQSIIIPSTVLTIENLAFSGCHSLTSITIPKGVYRIENNAFYNCESLQHIYSYIEEPFNIPEDAFLCSEYISTANPYQIFDKANLYVPHGTKSKYSSTPSWHLFKRIYEMEQDGIKSLKYNPEEMKDRIYTFDGKEQKIIKKGVNIIRYKNGKTKKIVVKE